LEDHLIINGCRNGDETAFKYFVEKYAGMMTAICLRYLKDSTKAKDAVQETLIAVFKNIKQYNGVGSLGAWVSRIAVNTCLREIKRCRKLTDVSLLEFRATEISGASDHLEAEDLIYLINQMPDTLRLVFNLNLIEGFSHLEISEMLGISESSSRVYLLRARKLLKEKITENTIREAKVFKYN
jgi:RNA polymerase sigma-70 factor (ECF subfamily)